MTRLAGAVALLVVTGSALSAQESLNDLEMAHVAVTASRIDIAYAHLALAFSTNAEVRRFAETMIQDHTAANEQVFALARQLGVEAQDNGLSRKLLEDAAETKDRLSRLRGTEFDRAYARNELDFHRAVNELVAGTFIPNAKNAQVRSAFEGALAIFRGHERHAEMVVNGEPGTNK